MIKRFSLRLLISISVFFVLLVIYPVRNGITRPALLTMSLLIYAMMLFLFWNKCLLRYILIAFAALVTMAICLPGRSVNSASLQSAYVSKLCGYTSTRYASGAEKTTSVSIAPASSALRWSTPNVNKESPHSTPACSVKAPGFGGMTWLPVTCPVATRAAWSASSRPIPPVALRRIFNPETLPSPPMAHMSFAFLGNDRWIEADPISLHVIEWGTNDRPGYLDRPFQLLRWRCLATPQTYISSTTH